MILWMLDKIRVALTFSQENTPLSKAHVGFKFLSLILFFISITLVDNVYGIILISTYLVLVTLMSKNLRILYESSLAVIIPIALLGFFAWIFSPTGIFSYETLVYVLSLVVRIYLLAVSFLIIFSTTNPSQLACFLEKHGLPLVFSQSLILTWRLIPLVLKDVIESIMSIKLRRFPSTKALIPVTAVAIERANMVSEALYVKGLGFKEKRTIISSPGILSYGLVLTIHSLILLILVLILL